MKKIAAWFMCLAAALVHAEASAECPRPQAKFSIPEGSTASEKDLLAAQDALVKFDGEVGDYLLCIKGEASQQQVGKDEAGKQKVLANYVSLHNSIADELTGLAQCFNAQAEAFKASGGGTESKPVDCQSYIEKAAATNRTATPQEPTADGLVKEADGHTVELASGVWSYSLIRDDRLRRCGPKLDQQCLLRTVWVVNGSDETLECTGEIAYEGTDVAGKSAVQGKAVVLDKQARAIVSSAAVRNVNAKTFDANCTARPKLPALDTPATCKYEVVKPVTISDYYPPASREAGEEGPVVVEFSVGDKPANPKNVRAVASSLFPQLDEAAVKAVSDMVLSSNCKQGRYRLRLSFQLQ